MRDDRTVTTYTLKPSTVDAIQWDGTPECAAQIEALIGTYRFTPPDPGSEEGGWGATPAGVLTDPHRAWVELEPDTWVIKRADGYVFVLDAAAVEADRGWAAVPRVRRAGRGLRHRVAASSGTRPRR
jgi:hypothetical protein